MTQQIDSTLPLWARSIVVFDTETTGLNHSTARIVTACVAQLDESGALVGSAREWLANPGIEIPEVATNVHGITTQYAREHGEEPAKVVSEIISTLRDYQQRGIPVVAYNAPYDFTILHFEALRYGLTPLEPTLVLDPLILDKYVDQYRKGKRNLEAAAALYGVVLDGAHNATADAVASGRVLQAIARRYGAKLPAKAEDIHACQVGWASAQEASFAEYMRRSVNPDFKENPGWPLKLGTAQ